MLLKVEKLVIESMYLMIDEERHPTVSHENDHVIRFDLMDPKMLVDDLKIGKDKSEPGKDVRKAERTDNVYHDGEMPKNNILIENNGWESDKGNRKMPALWRRQRKSAGCVPIRYGFKQHFLVQEGIIYID